MGNPLPQDASRAEQLKEIEEAPEFVRAKIASGEDCDQLASAAGKFGHAPTNPIPVNSIVGEFKYLNRLRCSCGAGLIFHRLGSLDVGGIPERVDVFEAVCLQGKHWDILCLHLYHPRRSTFLPEGYSFSEFHPIFSKTPWGYGTNQRVDTFPFGLEEPIAENIGGTLGEQFSKKYKDFVRNEAQFKTPTGHIEKKQKMESMLTGSSS